MTCVVRDQLFLKDIKMSRTFSVITLYTKKLKIFSYKDIFLFPEQFSRNFSCRFYGIRNKRYHSKRKKEKKIRKSMHTETEQRSTKGHGL